MNRRGVGVLVLSLIVFMLGVAVGAVSFTKNVSTFSSRASFSGSYNGKGQYREIQVKEDTVLRFKISGQVEKGNLRISLVSPENQVVYQKEGKRVSDIQRIPVTAGTWRFKVDAEDGERGSYYLLGQINYR